MNTFEIIGLILGSGAVVAIINQVGNYIFDRRKRRDVTEDRNDDAQNQLEKLRAESAEQFTEVNQRIGKVENKVESVAELTEALCNNSIARSYIEIRKRALACIKAGEVSGDEQRDVEELYKAYIQLPGANGYLEPIMHEFRKLKII